MVGIQASRNFSDYSIFLSGMAKALFAMKNLEEDNVFTIFSAGPHRLNQMAEEYLNVSNFKARGIKTKLVTVPPSWFKKNHSVIDQFSYFCNARESLSEIVDLMDSKDVPSFVYRY
jgi:L-rhamnose mutarotase